MLYFFLCALNREPQTLDELVEKISIEFDDVDKETIKKDAEKIYETIIEDGFIIKGEPMLHPKFKEFLWATMHFVQRILTKQFVMHIYKNFPSNLLQTTQNLFITPSTYKKSLK